MTDQQQQPTPDVQADGSADVTPEQAERMRALLADIAGPASLPITLAGLQRTMTALGGTNVPAGRGRQRMRRNH